MIYYYKIINNLKAKLVYQLNRNQVKKTFTQLSSTIVLGLLITLYSCSEKDPLPMSQASFDVQNAATLEKDVPVKFINASTNAASFVWDFGDGTFDSTSVAPDHTYVEEGTYDVTLTAVTEDGQTSSETKPVDIKTRVLVAFSIANIDFVKRFDETGMPLDPPVPWDEDETGPDLIFIFGAQSADLEDIIFTDTVPDLEPKDLPLEWEFPQGQGLELTSETFDLVLLDADPEKPETENQFDLMFAIELDPVQYVFSIKEEDQGLMQVSIGGFAIDLYLTFELQ